MRRGTIKDNLLTCTIEYRRDPPIRNSEFLIWAKGKGDLARPKLAILRKSSKCKGDSGLDMGPRGIPYARPLIGPAGSSSPGPSLDTFKKAKAV